MATFDTVIVPTQVTPSTTSDTTLYTAVSDTQALVTITNIDTANTSATARVGITPSGGSVHWKAYEFPVDPGAPIQLGPFFLRSGDAITVGVGGSDTNDIVFSVAGTRTT
jgi:hypothetical protein